MVATVVGPVVGTVVIGPLGEESEQGAVEFMYWYWIYSANYWEIYMLVGGFLSQGPNVRGPIVPQENSGKLGPGAQLSEPQL